MIEEWKENSDLPTRICQSLWTLKADKIILSYLSFAAFLYCMHSFDYRFLNINDVDEYSVTGVPLESLVGKLIGIPIYLDKSSNVKTILLEKEGVVVCEILLTPA